jgi:hypothetical protein
VKKSLALTKNQNYALGSAASLVEVIGYAAWLVQVIGLPLRLSKNYEL